MNKGKKGRKNKYLTDVKPRFDEIAEMCKLGATDKEIAENLGIHKATFCDYKNRYSEFNELIKRSRQNPILQIKKALFKRACGFKYSEKKIITNEAGEVKEEEYIKYALPDPASAMILLKHWARDEGWTNDPAQLAIKKKELELKEKALQAEDW